MEYPKKALGRYSDYNEAIAEYVCEEITMGKSLATICNQEGMPDRMTVLRWLRISPEFNAVYREARLNQADTMDDLILDTAYASTYASANADRVKIDAFKWRAIRLNARVYGDKTETTLVGNNGGPVKTVSVVFSDPIDAAKSYQKLINEEATVHESDDGQTY